MAAEQILHRKVCERLDDEQMRHGRIHRQRDAAGIGFQFLQRRSQSFRVAAVCAPARSAPNSREREIAN
jgi:hypothetical protein